MPAAWTLAGGGVLLAALAAHEAAAAAADAAAARAQRAGASAPGGGAAKSSEDESELRVEAALREIAVRLNGEFKNYDDDDCEDAGDDCGCMGRG